MTKVIEAIQESELLTPCRFVLPFYVEGRVPLLLIPEIAAMVASMSIAADHWTVGEDLIPHFMGALLSFPPLYLFGSRVESMGNAMAEAWAEGRPIHQALDAEIADLPQEEGALRRRLAERSSIIRVMTAQSVREMAPQDAIGRYLQMTDALNHVRRTAGSAERAEEMLGNINAFVAMTARAKSLVELLDKLGPLAAQKRDQRPTEDALIITTCHRAKGREWPTVLIAGLGAGQFPSDPCADREEERRLAYVAITRAIRRLVLLHPFDENVDAMVADTAHVVPTEHVANASSLLYESDVGLACTLAKRIAGTDRTPIVARTIKMAERYLAAIGIADQPLSLAKPPPVAETLPAKPDGLKTPLYIGARIWVEEHGEGVVLDHITGDLYQVEFEDAARFLALNDVNWSRVSTTGKAKATH